MHICVCLLGMETKMKYRTEDLPEAGFEGSTLFVPDQTPQAAVMLLHGSEGHPSHWTQRYAAFLAEHGYAALYFAWYGYRNQVGLPDSIIDVDLERTVSALYWLKEKMKRQIFLMGVSRGAEQAMIVASLIESRRTQPPVLPNGLILHAATDQIAPPFSEDQQLHAVTAKPWRWENSGGQDEIGTRIEIERYQGVILLSHGVNDDLWEIDRSERILDSLRNRPGNLARRVRVLFHKGEGHVLSARAQHRFDKEVLKFLQ
jgi:pimeloyl-ACP methyl ester carboxylesterase